MADYILGDAADEYSVDVVLLPVPTMMASVLTRFALTGMAS
jgi:hypothetical protein